jgi:3-dehydroquinate dehydratase II
MPRYLVLNGPNLDRLGRREPEIYGSKSLNDLEDDLRHFALGLAIELDFFQSNRESEITERLVAADGTLDGIVLNPGALTPYSRALGDTVGAISTPVVEVHISNILEREPWRRRSVIGPAYRVYGRGIGGYRWAIRHLQNRAAASVESLRYGPLPDQVGDLRTAAGAEILVMIVHGGLWRHEWTADTTESIAIDLWRRGIASYNIEYRRMGLGGGWPESFADMAVALRRTPDLTGFSADRVVVLGHSAGATMCLWAEHPGLTVALAPFCDLVEARAQGLAGDTFRRLLAEPLGEPNRYSPAHRLPREGAAVVVASPADRLVPIDQIRRYVEVARQHGSTIDLLESPGGHFDLLEPSTSSWGLVMDALGARNATV